MRLNRRDWRLPALAVIAFAFAKLGGGRLPYSLFYMSGGVILLAFFWTFYAWRRIDGQVTVSSHRAEIGKSIKLSFRLENKSLLPLAWAEIDDQSPAHMVAVEMPRQAASLSLRGSRIFHFGLQSLRRGHFTAGPIRLTIGDPFGLFVAERYFHSSQPVTVYPKVHRIEDLQIPLSQPFGPVRTRERAFEDPSNQAEIRKYRPGDNPRHIHWKTSARMGSLMLREYELNATTQIMLFPDMCLDVHTGPASADLTSTEENCAQIAASIAFLALRRRIDMGLICHGQERFTVSPGHGERTFRETLEVLARVEGRGSVPMEQLLEMETVRLSGKSTLVVITPQLTVRLTDLLIRLKANHPIMLILLNRESFAAKSAQESTLSTHPLGVPNLIGLLLVRGLSVYGVNAGDQIRQLAGLRLTLGQEGVKSWSSVGRLSVTKS